LDNIRSKLSKKSKPSAKSKDVNADSDSGDELMIDQRPTTDDKRAEILREIKALKKDLKGEKAAAEKPKEEKGKKRSKSETEEEESNDLLKSLKEEKVIFYFFIFS